MTDPEIRLLLLTLTPYEILGQYVPSGVSEIARAAFDNDQLENAVWACAPLVRDVARWPLPTQWASRRDTLLTEWALKGIRTNPAYSHLHVTVSQAFAWTAQEAVNACNRDGYTGIAKTFGLLTREPLTVGGNRPKFVSEALLFYKPEKRDEAATTLLRDLCRLFYD